MKTPPTVSLSGALREIQRKWLEAPREKREIIYAKEFGPSFVPLFARLPLHGWEGERPHFKALISILGLSWQPVALMSAWVSPDRILLLGTRDSLNKSIGDESALDVICRLAKLNPGSVEVEEIEDSDELGIYKRVKEFVKKHGYRPKEIAVDPTGGKKSMSASAALAGYLSGAWILYVDYTEYLDPGRIPVAGTEFPRLLGNPLDVFGDLEIEKIKDAFRNGNYEEAFHLAENLAGRLYQPREVEGLAILSEACLAWSRFDFQTAKDRFGDLRDHIKHFSLFERWSWSRAIASKVEVYVDVLTELVHLIEKYRVQRAFESVPEGLPLVLNHLASAERYLEHGRYGEALLLAYATLERYVDLILLVEYGLDDEKPQYEKLDLDYEAFHEMGRILHKGDYRRRDLGGPITLAIGVQLLATLNPKLIPRNLLGPIKGLTTDRNKSEFEHGLSCKVLDRNRVRRHIDTVKKILRIGFSAYGKGNLDEMLEKYRFPEL